MSVPARRRVARGEMVMVNNATLEGSDATIIGNGNTVHGDHLTVTGNNNHLYAAHSRAIGNGNTIYTDSSTGIGANLTQVSEDGRSVSRVLGQGITRVHGDLIVGGDGAIRIQERGGLVVDDRTPALTNIRMDNVRIGTLASNRGVMLVGGPPQPKMRPAIKYPAMPKTPEPHAPEDTDESKLCTLCLERRRATVVSPCGHSYACITCMAQHKPAQCAYCKASIERVLRLHHV